MTPNLNEYDRFIVFFSAGKDSLACFLHLLKIGVPTEKIELWHHEIDGREGSKLMDWPCTTDYARKFAAAFGVPIYYSWKKHGFEGEMTRTDALTKPNNFELPDGTTKQTGGIHGTPSTRRKFPQVSANLSVRWCSSYLKINVAATALRNQDRFVGKKIICLSGERGEESPNRAKYEIFEPHMADLRNGRKPRHIDHWRPIRDWSEEKVWEIIEAYKIRVHPAYYLGWGRVSCAACIFGSKHQFASLYAINPEQVEKLIEYEKDFGVTMKRDKTIIDLLVAGTEYDMKQEDIDAALSDEYTLPIFTENWFLPAGAFGESCGAR